MLVFCLQTRLNTIDSAPVSSADAGQCVSFALKRVRRTAVRKGMVIVAKTETPPKGVWVLLYSFVHSITCYMQQQSDLRDKCWCSSGSCIPARLRRIEAHLFH